jgi:hypothetical protein
LESGYPGLKFLVVLFQPVKAYPTQKNYEGYPEKAY